MGWFGGLFGRRPGAQPALTADAFARSGPAEAPATIKVFDAYGRMIEVSREEWRRKVLPASFQRHWTEPDELANLVEQSLQDGFVAEALPAARQLCRIDGKGHRSATLLGVVLLQLEGYHEAEAILREALHRQGENGVLLTTLAKAQAGLGQEDLADRTLWRALEVDPNQDNGLLWYAVRERQRGGQAAEAAAFRRAASLPGSWRAQLWLARQALEDQDLGTALNLYDQALGCMGTIPADALMQISGDLGNHGFLRELLRVCGPYFEAAHHGLAVGNNLIKAHVDLGDAPRARRVLEQLYAQQRPDWQDHLLFWESEIDKLDKGYGPMPQTRQVQISLLKVEGPIWTREGAPFVKLLPGKSEEAPHLVFLAGSVEGSVSEGEERVVAQPSDAPGRFSRGLPLFLAEQVHLRTVARTFTFVPWLKLGGFVLSSARWQPEVLRPVEERVDYAVLLHLVTTTVPWRAEFTLMRFIDHQVLALWEQEVHPNQSAAAIEAAARRLFEKLRAELDLTEGPVSEWLFPPSRELLPNYLLGLEQALSVASAARAPDTRPFLYAERSILEHLLHLCVQEPHNVVLRFLFLSTLGREAKARPDIACEFQGRVERLQSEHPLAQPAQSMTLAAVAQVFSETTLFRR